MEDVPFKIADRTFQSRLIVGTGKYPSHAIMKQCHEASGTELVTVAVRRLDLSAKGEAALLHWIDRSKITLLPNTAGCYTAEEAIRTCYLAEELGLTKWVKLEVLGDSKTLFPDVEETLAAARTLVQRGFTVLPYTSDDPVAAKKLEDLGCAAVMPLAAPIGSGLGSGDRDGVGLRRSADEHRDCWCQGAGTDGRGDEKSHRSRARGFSRRTDPAQGLRLGLQSNRGPRPVVPRDLPRLIVITDWRMPRALLLERDEADLAFGPMVALQHRHPEAPIRLFLEEARWLAELCHQRQNPLFINGRLDVALLLGADLHLP